MQLLLKLTLILCFVTPTASRGINQKPHPDFIPLGTAVLTRGETKSYKNLRKIGGDIEYLALCKNEYIQVEPLNATKRKGGAIRFMLKISVAENTPYGEYYAPVYYSTYTDKHEKVHEDVGEVKIIVQETSPTPKHPLAAKILRQALGIIIVALCCIVGLAMVLYVVIRIVRGSQELDIEAEEDDEENTNDARN